jgi:S1-C subfamily serine protease
MVNTKLEVDILKKRKLSGKKKAWRMFIVLTILWVIGVFMFNTYQKIEINENSYIATKVKSTTYEQTVEKAEENSKKIADVIEDTTQKVVGISKLKEPGNTILSKSTESELGLGTGVIITQDGYIISNEHVTGSKYSKCYVTLENGTNYDGTVVWEDSNLDLSIIKINAKDLPYVNLGDSKNIRVGETVYAIRKSNRIRV